MSQGKIALCVTPEIAHCDLRLKEFCMVHRLPGREEAMACMPKVVELPRKASKANEETA